MRASALIVELVTHPTNAKGRHSPQPQQVACSLRELGDIPLGRRAGVADPPVIAAEHLAIGMPVVAGRLGRIDKEALNLVAGVRLRQADSPFIRVDPVVFLCGQQGEGVSLQLHQGLQL